MKMKILLNLVAVLLVSKYVEIKIEIRRILKLSMKLPIVHQLEGWICFCFFLIGYKYFEFDRHIFRTHFRKFENSNLDFSKRKSD